MNPYANYLGERDALEVIAGTPGQLNGHLKRLGTDGLKRSYAPGKWTARVILSHLADTELAFAFRLRQALAEPHHVIQPFDQEAWAKPYGSFDPQSALDTFSAVRRWNLALLHTLSPDDFSKRVSHPERGEMTFRVLVETMAGHDLNHLHQLDAIKESGDSSDAVSRGQSSPSPAV